MNSATAETSTIFGPRLTGKTSFKAIGACIYCGSETYNALGGALHDEHIIPEALGGRWLLPQASCQSCERATSYWEAKLLRGPLESVRRFLQLPSKKTHDKRNKLPLFRSGPDFSPFATSTFGGGEISGASARN